MSFNQAARKICHKARATSVIAAAVAMALTLTPGHPSSAELTVKVQGANDAQGKIAVALFAQADGFPKNEAKALSRQFVTIDTQRKASTAVFDGLEPGVYAVSVFHDKDNSGKLETSLFGVPLKGYGFSQNANPAMRAARFDEAQFELAEPGAAVTITLIYR